MTSRCVERSKGGIRWLQASEGGHERSQAPTARGSPPPWTRDASRDAPHLHFAVSLVTPRASWGDAGTPLNPYGLLQSGTY